MKQVLLTLFFALLSVASWAYDAEVDGIYYNLNTTTKTATVTSGSSKYSGNVIIPEAITVNGINYSVTSIGNSAFRSCSDLTSVRIPNSVTSIGDRAFMASLHLTSVIIPNSVTSIGNEVFRQCLLNSISVENGNTIYDSRENCNAIIETSTNTLIKGCQNTIIPNSVTSIGNYAFSESIYMTSVVIPNSVTNISDGAFYNCSGLTSLEIPNSVTSISNNAFCYCSSLTSISVESGNTVYDSRENCNAIIETSTNSLILGCQNSVIPSSVTNIGDYAFFASSFTSIEFPNSVVSIGESAYAYGYQLTSVTIPQSVARIGKEAFTLCM